MINTDVVLVLGAGASEPFGYPLGGGLKILAQQQAGNLTSWLITGGFRTTQATQFFTDMERSGRSSIDEFLEFRPEYEHIGKRVIAKILVHYEQPKTLFAGTASTNWYTWLFQRLTEDGGFDGIAANRIAFITFNYDRSLEYFLCEALEASFGKSPEEAAKKVQELRIVHVHGILSPLPHFGKGGRSYSAEGADDSAKVSHAAESIRIVHQVGEDDPVFRQAHELLRGAQFILFLGFGYARRNVQRLKLSVANPKEANVDPLVHVTGTTLGFYRGELEVDVLPLFMNVHGGFRVNEDTTLMNTDVITYLRSHRRFFTQ